MLGRAAIGVVLLALVPAFTCKKPPTPPDPDAASCAAACAALARAQCLFEGDPADAEARCAVACQERSQELASASCTAERRAYLACIGQSSFDCRPLSCSASVCLEQGLATPGCAAEFSRFKSCVAPCLQAGTTHVGARAVESAGAQRAVKTELVRAGCEKCTKVKPGAGEGAACEAHSVCGQSCCRCPNGRTWFLARTCADGRCASGEAACELGRAAAPADPCNGGS